MLKLQMDDYTVAVFGHKGWIGSQFVPYLEAVGLNVIPVPDDIRADDVYSVRTFLDTVKPSRVVSLIGRTHGPECPTIDYLEDEAKSHEKLKLNLRDNLFSPVTLALACIKHDIHFSYLGTGCIFDDIPPSTKRFKEDDDPNFFGSAYSVVKGYTDRIMRQLADDVLQIRIRMPITDTDHPRNFITKITKYEKVCSIENSMTVLPTLLPVFAQLVKRKHKGTINLTNPNTICHERILQLFQTYVDPSFKFRLFTIEEQNDLLKSKRSNNHLDTTVLETLFPDVPDVETAIIHCLKRWKRT